jgi:hypothetical protein
LHAKNRSGEKNGEQKERRIKRQIGEGGREENQRQMVKWGRGKPEANGK